MSQNGFCFFCHTRDHKTTNDVLENNSFVMHLSDNPINPGHVEIFTKRHVGDVVSLTEDEQKDLFDIMKKAVEYLKSVDLKAYYEDKDGVREIALRKNNTERTYQVTQHYKQQMLSLPFLGQKPTGFNYGINQGLSAGQTVMHLHLHIVPRFDGDTTDPTGGVRNFLNDLGNYKKFLK